MREKQQKQMPLMEPASSHPQERELEAISNIIDNTPTISEYVLQDLNRGRIIKRRTGARGMSADQVLRAAIVMHLFDFTYEQLAFNIYDSRCLRRFCRIGIADKHVGYVKRLPIPMNIPDVSNLVQSIINIKENACKYIETSSMFIKPLALEFYKPNKHESIKNFVLEFNLQEKKWDSELKQCVLDIDDTIETAFGLSESDKNFLETVYPRPPISIWQGIDDSSRGISEQFIAQQILSYCLGVVLGRFDIRYHSNTNIKSNGNAESWRINKNFFHDKDYPFEISKHAIWVDDAYNKEDITSNVQSIMKFLWKDRAEHIELELCEILSLPTLNDYFRGPNNFFSNHLKQYTKSRRQAPIYWPLSTVSGSYTLWLYYHRLTDQTLYLCMNDFVEPKLKHISEEIDRLLKKANRNRKEEKDLERLSNMELELKDFRDELLRIAKFWKPNLTDGVQINAAPLWKLFQHIPWQNALKLTWKNLEEGDYDWARLAYAIWPERVIRTSHKDHSYSIAHHLEADLWEEIENGTDRQGNPKYKWVPKKLTESEMNDLIRQKINEI